MRHLYLILSLLFLGFSTLQAQQDLDEEWNLREKDRLIESIEKGESYQGVIKPDYEFEAHSLDLAADTVVYTRLGNYDSIVCKYSKEDAEKVVANIFRDMLLEEAEACSTSYRTANVALKQSIIGYRNGEPVAVVQLLRNQYGLIDSQAGEIDLLQEGLMPLAVIDEAMLILDQNANSIYIKKGEEQIPIDYESQELLKQSKLRSSMVSTNKGKFYLPIRIEDKMGIASVNPNDGGLEIVAKTAILNGFSDEYIYMTTTNGFSRRELEDGKEEVLIPAAFFELIMLPPFIIPDQKDEFFYLSLPTGLLIIMEEDLFKELDIDFDAYLKMKESSEEMKVDFGQEDIYPWDYYHLYEAEVAENEVEESGTDETEVAEVETAEAEEMEEMEEAVEVEEAETATVFDDSNYQEEEQYEAPELPTLSKKQEKRIVDFFELKDELNDLKREKTKQLREVLSSSKNLRYAYLPSVYGLTQHPIDKSILIYPPDPTFPPINMDDLMMIDVDDEMWKR